MDNDPSLLLRTIVVVILFFPPEGLAVVVAFLLPELVAFLPGEEVIVELLAPVEVLVGAVELLPELPVAVVFADEAVVRPVGRREVGPELPVVFVDAAADVVVLLWAVASTGRKVRRIAART